MAELDKLLLYGMKFYGYHGVNPEEKVLGQWFEIDLDIWGSYQQGAASDDIEQTLNYSHVYKAVKGIVEGESVNLIEHLAYKICNAVIEFPLVEKVLVRVKKPGAPLGGPLAYAGIEMERCKNG